MTKHEFLGALYDALSPLTPEERNRSLAYYEEVIDDKLEEGEQESKIIADFGPVADIAQEILGDTPTQNPSTMKQGSKAIPLILIIAGSPLWFPLLIAGVAVLFAIYVVVWSLIISFFAVVFSLLACGLGGIGILIFNASTNMAAAFGGLGVGFICAGLGLLLLFPCIFFAKWLTQNTVRFVKYAWHKMTSWLKGAQKNEKSVESM